MNEEILEALVCMLIADLPFYCAFAASECCQNPSDLGRFMAAAMDRLGPQFHVYCQLIEGQTYVCMEMKDPEWIEFESRQH